MEVFFTLNCFAAAIAEILYDNLYELILKTNYMARHTEYTGLLYILVCIFYFLWNFYLQWLEVYVF